MKLKVVLLSMAQLLMFQQLALAHALVNNAPGQSFSHASPGINSGTPRTNQMGTINLDLTSTKATLSAASLGLNNARSSTINLKLGAQVVSFSLTSLLTPAELVAANEVITSGRQTLKLGLQGSASGGRFSIPLSLSQSLANLVIPAGVKLVDNAALYPSITLSGNLIDAGKIVVFSSNQTITSAALNADNIFVQQGGVLTSVSGKQNNTSLNLTLDALGGIINAGEITSSGSLSANATRSIMNIAGQSSAMQGADDVNLFASAGNFTNNGTVRSLTGNVNISAGNTSAIAFNNANGNVLAANGAINFRNLNYAGSANTKLTGGNFLSQSLNLYAGTGSVDMSVDQVSGVVNTYAGSAHLSANTPNLQIGVFDVSGDPWINSSGNLDLGGTITGPLSYLVATAGGSIYTSLAGESIDTSAGSGNVVLAAGVTAVDSSGSISLTRSQTGGDIVLASGQTIDGNATQDITAFTTGGGNVTLIAMTDGNAASVNGGHVIVPTGVPINSTSGGGSAGTVTILAEASAGTSNAVGLGGVNAGGAGGAVTIRSATANLAGGTINDLTGLITGSFDSSTLQNGTLAPGAVAAGGALTIATNGTINLTGVNSAASAALAATTVYLANGSSLATTAGALTITGAVDNLTLTSDASGIATLNAVGGQLNISSTGSGKLLFTFSGLNQVPILDTLPKSVFVLDSDTGVNLTSNNQITIDRNVTVNNSNSQAAWTVTTNSVAIEKNGIFSTSNALTLNLNNGVFADYGEVDGASVSLLSTSTLTITGGLGSYGQDGSAYYYTGTAGILNATGPGAVVSIIAPVSVSLASGSNIALNAGGQSVQITTPTLLLASALGGVPVATLAASSGAITLQANNSGTGTLKLSLVGPMTTATFYLDGNSVSMVSTNLIVDNGVFFGSNMSLTVNVNDGMLSNNGTLNAGNLTIKSTGTLILNGIGRLGGSSPVVINADTSISFANGTSISNGWDLVIQTPLIQMGTGSNTGDVWVGLGAWGSNVTLEGVSGATSPLQFALLKDVSTAELETNYPASLNISSASLTMPTGLTIIGSNGIQVNSTGNITLSNMLDYDGPIQVINSSTTTGNISVLADSTIMAVEFGLVINNKNIANGSITTGANVLLSAASVQIIMGNPTTTIGKPPKTVTLSPPKSNSILFGANGITALAPQNYALTGSGGINFNTGNLPASAITLGGGNLIIARNWSPLSSLDLTNQNTAQSIKTEQSEGLIGGSLKIQNGVVVGGSLILTPIDLTPIITAENIPKGVTLSLSGFSSFQPLRVEITSQSSTTSDVVINGTVAFSGIGVMTVSSAVPGEAFDLGTTGILTSNAGLALDVAGNILLSGTISARQLLIVSQPDGAGNANITIAGTVGSASSMVALIALGSGNIIQGTAKAMVLGSAVGLQTDLGNIGATTAINTQARTLELSTDSSGTGSANVIDTLAVVLTDTTTAGSLLVSDTSAITVDSVQSDSGSIILTTPGILTLAKSAQVTEDDGNIYLNSSNAKSGSITIGAKASISATGAAGTLGDVSISIGSLSPAQLNTKAPLNLTANLSNNGQIFYGTNNITSDKPINTINTNGATVTFSTGTLRATAITLGGSVTITAAQAINFAQDSATNDELVIDTGDGDE